MDHKMKSQWESSNFIYDKDYGYDGISWRQRNFMCNFCKKEYKSAQALGGHMNVHRRDRARLRLSSPPLDQANPNSNSNSNQNPNPNPNPNFTSPPSPLGCLPYKTFHSSLFTLSSPSITMNIEEKQEVFPFVPHFARNFLGDIRNNMSMEGFVENGNFVTQENESMVWKKSGILRVEMEMDLLKDGKNETGLDLELRLGRS